MKIKSILKLGTLALLTAALPACSFLDTDPQIIPDDGYYNSEQKLIYGLAGVYGVLNSEAIYGNYYSLQIANADDLCYFNNYNNSESRPDRYNHSAARRRSTTPGRSSTKASRTPTATSRPSKRRRSTPGNFRWTSGFTSPKRGSCAPTTTSCWRRRGAMCPCASRRPPRPTPTTCRWPQRRRSRCSNGAPTRSKPRFPTSTSPSTTPPRASARPSPRAFWPASISSWPARASSRSTDWIKRRCTAAPPTGPTR